MQALKDFAYNVRWSAQLRTKNREASRVIARFTGYDISTWRMLDGAMVEWMSRSERWSPPGLTPQSAAVIRLLELLETSNETMGPSLRAGLNRLLKEKEIQPEVLQLAMRKGWPRNE
jgi:hypothetical protein